MIMHRSSHLPQ